MIDGVPSWPESLIEELGTVTAPAGELVLIDFGCLRLWSGESEPALDPDVVGEGVAATANSAVDLEILGDSPLAAGRAANLAAVAGRYVFDIPASHVAEMRDLVASRARQDGFSVRVEPIARMPHRTRVARLLDDSPDGAEVLFGGPRAVAVRGLPAGRPLRVRAVRMPEDGYDPTRWHSIWVETDERPPARTEEIGYVLVDEARLAFAAPDALTAWRTDDPADGLVDVAFWGRDEQILIERTGAGTLEDGTHGWTDLPVQDAVDRATSLHQAKDAEGWRFAVDLRPHDDHHRLLSLAKTSPTESASVEIGGSVVCGFFTSWGDGAFPVRRDLADDGTLCRLRVEVGAPEIVERQLKFDDYWFGELSLAALATARVARGGAQVRWMYRQEPDNPRDSGWRVFAGDETDSEANDPENVVVIPLRDLVAADADLETLFRTLAPCAFERQHDGGFIAVEYQPPQDLGMAFVALLVGGLISFVLVIAIHVLVLVHAVRLVRKKPARWRRPIGWWALAAIAIGAELAIFRNAPGQRPLVLVLAVAWLGLGLLSAWPTAVGRAGKRVLVAAAAMVARSFSRGPVGWRRVWGLGLAAVALAALTAGCVALVNPVADLVNPYRGLRVLAAGTGPGSLALSPNGATLYVANYGNPIFNGGVPGNGQGDTVTPVNVATGKPGRPIRVGDLPDEMVMTPGGRMLYVMLDGDVGSGTVIPVDLAAGRAGKPLALNGRAFGIAMSPDGRVLYVSEAYGVSARPVLMPVSTATGRPGPPVTLPGLPNAFAAAPGGQTLYAAFGNDQLSPSVPDEIIPFSLRTGQAATAIRLPAPPVSLSLSPDGRTMYAIAGASYGPDEPPGPWYLFMISVQSGKLIKSVSVDSPAALTVAPAGTMLFVQTGGNSVVAINAATGKNEGAFKIAPAGNDSSVPGYAATSLLISPDGHALYASNGTQVAVIPVTREMP